MADREHWLVRLGYRLGWVSGRIIAHAIVAKLQVQLWWLRRQRP